MDQSAMSEILDRKSPKRAFADVMKKENGFSYVVSEKDSES